jgi:hypothetical protein
VLGDVGHPQLIGRRAGELAVHQVIGRRCLMFRPRPTAARQAFDLGAAHQQIDGAVPDGDAQAQGEPATPSR